MTCATWLWLGIVRKSTGVTITLMIICDNEQYQDPESEATKLKSDIIDFII